ncbi:MAG: hypothetical protein U0528_17030 [Anaerolineae bacterium]
MFKTPHTMIHDTNPVFDFELRHLKWLAQPQRLWRYSAVIQMLPSLILSVIYVLVLNEWLHQWIANGRGLTSFQSYTFYDAAALWIIIIMAASLLLALVGGWYYLGVTVNSINQEMNSGRWDQLRLTPLAPESIIAAKETIAEVRAWRVMNIEVALRLLLLTLLLLLLLLPFDVLAAGQPYITSLSTIGSILRGFQEKPLSTAVDALLVLVVAVTYAYEPRWRMQALVAMGLALSSQIRNTSMASLAAFFGLFGFHIVQAAWTWFALMIMIQLTKIMDWGYRFLDGVADNTVLVEVGVLALKIGAVAAVIGIVYLYYALVRSNSRHTTLKHAFRSEGDTTAAAIQGTG